MKSNRALWVFAGLLVIAFMTAVLYNERQVTETFSEAEAVQFQQISYKLAELDHGDFVNMTTLVKGDDSMPRAMADTYEVIAQYSPGTIYMRGPGPMSNNTKLWEFNWLAINTRRDLLNRQIAIVRRDDPGYNELASWYYLQ
jgi:hypothetical protein